MEKLLIGRDAEAFNAYAQRQRSRSRRYRASESGEWVAEEYEHNPRLAEIWQVVPFSGKMKDGRRVGCDLVGGRKLETFALLDEARFQLAERGIADTWSNLCTIIQELQPVFDI